MWAPHRSACSRQSGWAPRQRKDVNELTRTGKIHKANWQAGKPPKLIKKQPVFFWKGVWFWYFSSSLGNVFMCKTSSVNHTVADFWGSTILCVTPRSFAAATVNCFVKARKKMIGFANLDADWMIQHWRQVCKLISHTNVGMIFFS